MAKKIGIFIGSLRKDSYNRHIANALMDLFPEGYEPVEVSLEHLSFYNQDLDDENRAPEDWQEFRSTVNTLDAALFITPEYNRSVPAVLKNAIDVGSRPYNKSCWNQMPAGIISVSTGRIGGFGANHHLRQSLAFLNMPTMAQPELYLGDVSSLLDANGALESSDAARYLEQFVDAYIQWIDTNAKL